jgi:hypothetical protein
VAVEAKEAKAGKEGRVDKVDKVDKVGKAGKVDRAEAEAMEVTAEAEDGVVTAETEDGEATVVVEVKVEVVETASPGVLADLDHKEAKAKVEVVDQAAEALHQDTLVLTPILRLPTAFLSLLSLLVWQLSVGEQTMEAYMRF